MKLKWQKQGKYWVTNYNGFTISTATAQKWQRCFGKPYFKLIHRKGYIVEHSPDLRSLVAKVDSILTREQK